MSRTAKARKESPRSTSGLRAYGSSPHPSPRVPRLWRTPWTSNPRTQRTSGWLSRGTQGWRPRKQPVSTRRLSRCLEPGLLSLRWTGPPFSDTDPPFRGAPRGPRRKTRHPTRVTSSGPSGPLLPLTINPTSSRSSGLWPPPRLSRPPWRKPRGTGRTRSWRRRCQSLRDRRQRLQGCRRGLRGRCALRLPRPGLHFPHQRSSAGCPGGQRHEDPSCCRGRGLS